MIVTSITEFKSKRYKVCFDNGADFVLYSGEVRKLQLKEGVEISETVFDRIVSEILVPRAKSRAMHLLEKQDRTEADLRNKLSESGYESDVIDEAVDFVKSFGYIDDKRYASNYIHFHQDRKSKKSLVTALSQKGINRSIIEQALVDEYDVDEALQLHDILVKRHYNFGDASYEEKGKQFRYLLSKGYSVDAIRKALDSDSF